MKLIRWLPLAVCIAVFAAAFSELSLQPAVGLRPSPPPVAGPSETALKPRLSDTPSYQTQFLSDGSTRLVHAPSLVQAGNNVVAVWFGGTREGAKDVNLYADRTPLGAMDWSRDWIAMTPQRTSQAQHRHIKKLGNAVLAANDDGSLSMFYVSVSLGGWATSALNRAVSVDGGLTFGDPARLVTSPMFNLSTLVKGTPLHFSDGSTALPVYHELAGKFGELLRIADDGRVLDKTRITARRYSLQPIVFADNENQATALLRYCGKTAPHRVVAASSQDGGNSWSETGKTSLANPNAAITGVRLDTGEYLLVLNDTEDERNRLGLFATGDGGKSFRVLHYFEDMSLQQQDMPQQQYQTLLRENLTQQGLAAPAIDSGVARAAVTMCNSANALCNFQFDYPYLIQSTDGGFHLAYTWNKAFIKYVSFNRAWLETLL